jgi:hypothetical protein
MSMIPPQPANSFRVTLTLPHKESRLDSVLMEALRAQNKNLDLRNLTRGAFKELFKNKRILIKGQPARPASSLSGGTTYVDILGFE